jgi:hypothetical protein
MKREEMCCGANLMSLSGSLDVDFDIQAKMAQVLLPHETVVHAAAEVRLLQYIRTTKMRTHESVCTPQIKLEQNFLVKWGLTVNSLHAA